MLLTTLYHDENFEQKTKVAIIDAASGQQIGNVFTSPGGYHAKFNADGTRVVVASVQQDDDSSYTSRVTVLSATTGNPIGLTVRLSGSVNEVAFNQAGTAAVLQLADGQGNAGAVARVVLISLATGRQIGSTLQLPGFGSVTVLGSSSNRAVFGGSYYENNGAVTPRFMFFDTNTGAQVGQTTVVPQDGSYGNSVVSADGSRLVMIREANSRTTIAVFDTASGTQIGIIENIPGGTNGTSWTTPMIDKINGRLLLTTVDPAVAGERTVRFTVVDTRSGRQIGSTLVVGQGEAIQTITNPGGTRAVMVIRRVDPTTRVETTRLVTVNTETGTQTASSATFSGNAAYGAQLIGDGSKILLGVSTDGVAGSTRLVLLNTETGAQIGPGVTTPGSIQGVRAGGARAIVLTSGAVSFLDLTTGTQIGQTSSLGTGNVTAHLSSDGTRAALTVYRPNFNGAGQYSDLILYNTLTGQQIGGTVTIGGRPADGRAQFSADGKYVVLAASAGTEDAGVTTVAVVDAVTGSQVGTNVVVPGVLWAVDEGEDDAVTFTADGRHIAFTTGVSESISDTRRRNTTNVGVVDLATGAQVGQTQVIEGEQIGWVQVNRGRDRMVVTTTTLNDQSRSSQAVVFDTRTGAVLK